MKYEGTYIFVSHDRYFISKAANKIWEIDNYEIKEFDGNYEEWVAWKKRMAEKKIVEEPKAAPVIVKQPEAPKPISNTPINKELKKELQKQQRLFQQLEEKIAALNKEKQTLEANLGHPDTYGDKAKFVATETRYKKNAQELAALNKEYEVIFEKIMELESQSNA
jgi:ATP-binding cassette, subfamily F, member 3